MQIRTVRQTSLAVAIIVGCTLSVAANPWNDRTILTFSEPVMVPGATLQPGTYVFQLMDSNTSRHTVQVKSEDGTKLITLAQAIPMKRHEPQGDIVVRFNPTDVGSPPAVKGWFYPGSIYGHEFVYPEEQAKVIAQRTKTIVLSVDVPGSDLQKGVLRTIEPSGARTEWHGDAATMREWDTWQRARPAGATMASGGANAQERREASAPMVKGDFQGLRVKLDDLEDNAQKYIGQTISVDAEIEDVFGPRIFTIDEPNWGDLQGEILVHVPTTAAALVRENDRVTVTGTVKPYVRAEVEREWGWLGADPQLEIELAKKPVLVATRIVGGNNDVALIINVDPARATPVGTTATSQSAPLTQLGAIAPANADLVGRHVNLRDLRVESVAKGGGFFVKGQQQAVFVLPAHQEPSGIRAGDTVSLKGIVLQMPRQMHDRLSAPSGSNDDIYVFATSVNK